MLHAHIKVPMDGPQNRNIFGAFALMISDDIVRATSSRAPEAGPTASALALLACAWAFTEGLIERRGHATDGHARSLYLTAAGRRAATKVLNARDQIIAEGLSVLSNEELVILGALSERVLLTRLQGLEHAYRVCRLCGHDACDSTDAELRQRALEDA